MHKTARCLLWLALLPTLPTSARLAAQDTRLAAQQPATHAATRPVPRRADWWQNRHAKFNDLAKQGNVDVIFVGDSITQGWEGKGREVWKNYYTPRGALNLGIGGDRTQHVLWRLDHGNLEGIAPKAAVVMIGTNNSNGGDHTAKEIGEGIQAVVKKLRAKQPKMKVLILAVFPSGEKPNAQREKNAQASALAAKLANDKNVFYLDIGPAFLQDDGTLTREIMPDLLHLSPKGYKIWAAAIEEKLASLLGEKPAEQEAATTASGA